MRPAPGLSARLAGAAVLLADWRSFLHRHEVNAVVLGAHFGAQRQAMFVKDLAASDANTLEQWRRLPLDQRLKELVARVWEHWL